MTTSLRDASLYERIYAVVRQIPAGKVASYGQVATTVGGCPARRVGYALSALKADNDVPWQRVINAQGKVSERSGGGGDSRQRRLLVEEGVTFDRQGRLDFRVHGWLGPEWEWLERNGFHPAPPPGIT